MDFSEVLQAMNQASAFELYRMRAAIDRVIDQPQWIEAIRSRLRVGQIVEYFDGQLNAGRKAQVLELRRKQVLVLDLESQKRWLMHYASINVDNADVQIREQVRRGLGRNEVAVGDVLVFIDRDQQERSGTVLRLHDKTVTLLCGRARWRVACALLHRVVDSQAIAGEQLAIAGFAAAADGAAARP